MALESKRDIALRWRLEGFTYQRIGEELGLSHQRIQQLLQAPKEIRHLIIDRAGNACQTCGINLSKGRGHVHHRLAKGLQADDWNDLDNLVYICLSCHRYDHSKHTRIAQKKPRPPKSTTRTARCFWCRNDFETTVSSRRKFCSKEHQAKFDAAVEEVINMAQQAKT